MAFTIALALALTSAPVPSDAAYEKCVDAGNTNFDYDRCGGAYIRRADAALNLAWKRLIAQVSPQTKQSLLAEQRAWLAYRNVACTFYSIPIDFGREGAVLSAPSCMADVIEKRTEKLNDYIESMKQPDG